MKFLSPEDIEILGEIDSASITKDVIAHFEAPDHMEVLYEDDGAAEVTGICEDVVCVQLKVTRSRITRACFHVKGCGFTVACGDVACALVEGQELKAAVSMTGVRIDAALGGLPREHRHCADLAAKAMQLAGKDAVANLRDPWKRAYRRS